MNKPTKPGPWRSVATVLQAHDKRLKAIEKAHKSATDVLFQQQGGFAEDVRLLRRAVETLGKQVRSGGAADKPSAKPIKSKE